MVRRELIELKWLDGNFEMSMTVNKQSKWFHSSRAKLSFVRMSANWFLVSSTYLIWFTGPCSSGHLPLRSDMIDVGQPRISRLECFFIFMLERFPDCSVRERFLCVLD